MTNDIKNSDQWDLARERGIARLAKLIVAGEADLQLVDDHSRIIVRSTGGVGNPMARMKGVPADEPVEEPQLEFACSTGELVKLAFGHSSEHPGEANIALLEVPDTVSAIWVDVPVSASGSEIVEFAVDAYRDGFPAVVGLRYGSHVLCIKNDSGDMQFYDLRIFDDES